MAETIGWPTVSPFQREMAFANLALGMLGVGALRQRDGYRTATVLATAVLGLVSTIRASASARLCRAPTTRLSTGRPV